MDSKQQCVMDIKKVKKRWNATILDILKAFMQICERHQLRYYCCAGTAIGAVRHHGIIPWDDDIDVIMPRPDYDRLLQIAKEEDFGNYEIISPYSDPTYPLYFSKISNRNTTLIEDRHIPCVTGLYVDIFPLDATDDNVEKAKRLKAKYTKIINRLNAVSTHNTFGEYMLLLTDPKEWGRFVIKTIAYFCRSKVRCHLIAQMDEISHRYDYDKARNVQVYTGSYGFKEVFPKEWLGEGKMFPFEDIEVPLPQEYDKYLRHFFNDYMQFPPEEQRVEKHHRAYVNLDRKETREEALGKLGIRD